ncbi:MAG: hypothetical protein R3242_05310 [Akkermansiaceae bacterium]|nr:hypothetical protein [Akkermansiaceae bacterium]
MNELIHRMLKFSVLPLALALLPSCDKQDASTASPETEAILFDVKAYPFFKTFWHPVRERSVDRSCVIQIKDGDQTHELTCEPLDEKQETIVLHLSNDTVHVGSNPNSELVDVSMEELRTTIEALVAEAADSSVEPKVALYARPNLKADRAQKVLLILADAGIDTLVAPPLEPGSAD